MAVEANEDGNPDRSVQIRPGCHDTSMSVTFNTCSKSSHESFKHLHNEDMTSRASKVLRKRDKQYDPFCGHREQDQGCLQLEGMDRSNTSYFKRYHWQKGVSDQNHTGWKNVPEVIIHGLPKDVRSYTFYTLLKLNVWASVSDRSSNLIVIKY